MTNSFFMKIKGIWGDRVPPHQHCKRGRQGLAVWSTPQTLKAGPSRLQVPRVVVLISRHTHAEHQVRVLDDARFTAFLTRPSRSMLNQSIDVYRWSQLYYTHAYLCLKQSHLIPTQN